MNQLIIRLSGLVNQVRDRFALLCQEKGNITIKELMEEAKDA